MYLRLPWSPSLLSLFLMTIIVPPSAAIMFCFRPYFHQEPAPSEADCRYILAHLPVLHARRGGDAFRTVRGDRYISHPFVPPATYRHGSCSIVLTISSNAAFRAETNLLAMWDMMREGAERIVAECVRDDREETTGGRMQGIVTLSLWYNVVVKVWATPAEVRQRSQQRALLENEVGVEGPQTFQDTFYDV